MRPARVLFGLVAIALTLTLGESASTLAQGEGTYAVLVGAGDIANCGSKGDEATALLLDRIAGTVFTLGDNAYPSGSLENFRQCYAFSWGRHKARTRPTPGNHDYATRGARGYFQYFGAAAGNPNRGYYSYDLAGWHVVVLNSNCAYVGGCDTGSPQDRWLRDDLAAHPAHCTLAYWHHPRFSSGPHGNHRFMRSFWKVLYDAGADFILSGHDHLYERFAPQNAFGMLDVRRGIRQFVVGTGGSGHYQVTRVRPNSEIENGRTYGVLRLDLGETGYEWKFLPVHGARFTDAGRGSCH